MILIDTTVIIDIWRGNPKIRTCIEKHLDKNFYLSAITISEIYDGLGYTREKKGVKLFEKIKNQFSKILEDFNVIPLNQQIIEEAGLMKGELRAKGQILDICDCLIGATAKTMKISRIITRNSAHFQHLGITVESY